MADKTKNLPKIGLALSGGSALGMAHIGVIKALKESKIPINYVSGTSAGSMAAVALAFDVPLKKMIELSKKMNWSSASKFGYSKFGLNTNAPVGEVMKEMIGDKKIEEAEISLAIVATNIDTGEEVVFRKGNVAEAVMASTCLPGYFIPVEIGGEKMVDGGLVENLPLSPLRKMGADVTIGVDLERWKRYKKTKNVLDVIINSYVTLIRPQAVLVSKEADILIEPRLEKFTSSDFEKADELIEKGYEAAKQKIAEIKKLLGKKEKPEAKNFLQKIRNYFSGIFQN